MSATLFSRDWYRVAGLKPRLRRFVGVHPHVYRSQRWYLLQDRMSGEFRRVSPAAYALIGLMDGRTTLDQIWARAAERLGEKLPSHEELLQLVANLYQSNIVRVDAAGDVDELLRREDDRTVRKWLAKLRSPLGVQVPLLDPERFVAATQRWVTPFFTRTFGVVIIALTAMLAVNSWRYWGPLTENLSDRVLAANNLFLLLIVYPLIKALHELGHAYAVKRGGGEVHEMGIMFLVFFPVPYVDASASTAFASKTRRMLVGAAGIIVELCIASIAMLVWIYAESGFTRAVAYNVVFIAGVSTLLFNGNPLLRFDAYYVLADFLEIPNLGQRSTQYWGYLAKRYLFGMVEAVSPAHDRRERGWLAAYGALSYAYRIFISITIILFISGFYFALGVMLAVWTVVGVWAWPLAKTLAKPFRDQEFRDARRRPAWVIGGLAALLALLLLVIPLPLNTTVEGAVSGSEHNRIVAGERCLIDAVLVPERASLAAGDEVLRCNGRLLESRFQVLEAQLAEVEARERQAFDDPVQLNLLTEEARQLDDERRDLEERIDRLTVRAPGPGVLTVPGFDNLTGRFVDRGQTVGWVVSGPLRIQVMVPEAHVGQVRDRTRAATLRFAGNWRRVFDVSQWSVSPGATRDLIAPVLAQTAGGSIAVVPTDDEPQTAENYFLADVQLGAEVATPLRIGERVYVRFEHPAEPVGFRLYRLLRRTFLSYFDV